MTRYKVVECGTVTDEEIVTTEPLFPQIGLGAKVDAVLGPEFKRVRIGKVRLGDLPLGQWRFLRADESF